jgi:predicted ATPase
MIERIELKNFKNFADATLNLGPLTVLVGANASGKSNIRDAFRFLHGIGRGYSLPEIIGEKWGEGGQLEWSGIRGGTREISYENCGAFSLFTKMHWPVAKYLPKHDYSYFIAVDVPLNRPPGIIRESLDTDDRSSFKAIANGDHDTLTVDLTSRLLQDGEEQFRLDNYPSYTPVLPQIQSDERAKPYLPSAITSSVARQLSSYRFLDLYPSAMRIPSLPGQVILGERGENLSSVLQAICRDSSKKSTLLAWVNELTPMDATDFDFPEDLTGKVLLTLIETSGKRTSAHSASDGTLRFLAMLAALLGPHPAKLYFIEELENGIHPARLSLLLDLLEKQTAAGEVQVIATTHSPQLLGFLSDSTLKNTSLVYRLEGRPDAQIKRVLDIPDAERVIKEYSAGRLLASGWFENMVEFMDDPEPGA